MTFEEQARAILQNKSSEKIDEFIKLCSEIKDYESLDDFKFRPETSIEFTANKEAFKRIRQLITLQLTSGTHYVDHKVLVDGLEKAFRFIQFNNSLKTGGKPSDLSIRDLFRLTMLQIYFVKVFPSNSGKFTQGNILHQLGAALTDKKLSGNVDRHINKMIENLPKL